MGNKQTPDMTERGGGTPETDAWVKSGCNPANIARKLELERNVLRNALEKAADTFRDYERGLRAMGRDTLADGCKIAEDHSRSALNAKVSHG